MFSATVADKLLSHVFKTEIAYMQSKLQIHDTFSLAIACIQIFVIVIILFSQIVCLYMDIKCPFLEYNFVRDISTDYYHWWIIDWFEFWLNATESIVSETRFECRKVFQHSTYKGNETLFIYK